MVAQLEGGAVDLIKAPPLRDAARLRADPNYKVADPPASAQHFQQGVNTTGAAPRQQAGAPGTELRARSQALCRDRAVRHRSTDRAPWLPSSPAYDAEKNNAFAFDLDKAKSLLDEGWGRQPLVRVTYRSAITRS